MENIRIIKAIFSFLGGIILIGVIANSIKIGNVKNPNKSYIYEGFADYSIEELGDSFFSKPIKLPNSISLHDSTIIVHKPETAAKIGILILSSKYGKEFIANQYPYEIYLINGKIWMVRGSKRNRRNSSSIYLQKADSKILRIQK